MMKQIRLLTKIQLCNLFQINEAIHTKDTKKRVRTIALALIFAYLLGFGMLYMIGMTTGLLSLGAGEVIPLYLFTCVSVFSLLLSFLRAAPAIFQMESYEMLISMPISNKAIVISRFLKLYIPNLVSSVVMLVPGMLIYGVNGHAGIGYYLVTIIGSMIAPLFPITISVAVGAVITAISSRMKNTSMAKSILSIGIVMVVLVGNLYLSANAEQMNQIKLEQLTSILTDKLRVLCPPAAYFANAATKGSYLGFLLIVLVYIVLFLGTVIVLERNFHAICMALQSHYSKKNFKLKELSKSSGRVSLYKKEFKRYFASSIYVSNTLMGYIMMIVLGIACVAAGPESIMKMLGLPVDIAVFIPHVLGVLACMMPITSCSISMEGKQWWIVKSLPISMKDILWSKLMVHLTIAVPCGLISSMLCLVALKPEGLLAVWYLIMPQVFILFAGVAGLTANIWFPNFAWESEMQCVKQSLSTLITMLMGVVVTFASGVLLVVLPAAYQMYVFLGTALVLAAAGTLMWKSDCKKVL